MIGVPLIAAGVALAAWAVTKSDERAYLSGVGALLVVVGWALVVGRRPRRRDARRRPGYIYDQEKEH